MARYAQYDKVTGEIFSVINQDVETEDRASMEIPDGQTVLPGEHYVADIDGTPTFADRPVAPEPEADQTAPWVYDWSTLPAGSSVLVRNEAGNKETFTDFSEPLTLTDPGSYLLKVSVPMPFVGFRKEVRLA